MKLLELAVHLFDREPQKPMRDLRYFHLDGTATEYLLAIGSRLSSVLRPFNFSLEGCYVVGSNRTGLNRRGRLDDNSDLDILVLFEYPMPTTAWQEFRKVRAAMNPKYSYEEVEAFYKSRKTPLKKRDLIDVIFDDSISGIEERAPVFNLISNRWIRFFPTYNRINRDLYRCKLAKPDG